MFPINDWLRVRVFHLWMFLSPSLVPLVETTAPASLTARSLCVSLEQKNTLHIHARTAYHPVYS